jgi:photosystem II stability/assembly factor-like uncharacterized protein
MLWICSFISVGQEPTWVRRHRYCGHYIGVPSALSRWACADPERRFRRAAPLPFGSVNGGVWETRDAGRTWAPIFDSAPLGSIGAIAVAPSDPKILYVGTGEADMRSDIAQGAGLFRSSDAGHSWQPIGPADSQQIGRILVDPANPNVVLVAALGHPYGPNKMRGVFRSADGGKSWRRTLLDEPLLKAGRRRSGHTIMRSKARVPIVRTTKP